jgi:FtsP/CotA-like multicopper oxidase with cupredoxin domain
MAASIAFVLLALAVPLAGQEPAVATVRLQADRPPRAIANDNRIPAGRRAGDTLFVRLEIRRAVWHLDRDADPGIPMLALAEEGKPPQVPGPLVRGPIGTVVDAMVRNTLERDTLLLHRLAAIGSADTLVVPPGDTVRARFRLDREGTYFYWGTTTRSPFLGRFGEDSNLGGALVVDPPDGQPRPDRILVLTEHGAKPSEVPGVSVPLFTAINGKSWPHTERFTYALGDSIRWRVVNASSSPHPMHLHGSYFRVDAKGGRGTDTTLAPALRRVVATERMLPGQTMLMTWAPDTPGGWLFHCHAVPHVAPHAPVAPSPSGAHAHGQDPDQHTFHGMGGLVVAVSVPPPRGYVVSAPREPRRLRLLVNSDSTAGDASRRFGYVLQRGDREPPADSVPIPGPTLVLTRGEPTVIEVVNRSPEPTSVHWHGIELESYFDGVVGVSGLPSRATPAIRPGSRFEARITPRRSGTFMYHTHFSELRQYVGGLTGALLVIEPGERWDPDRDRIFLIGDPRRPGAVNTINGSTTPIFADLHVGTRYRFRFMNVAIARPGAAVRLLRDGQPVTWRAIAKDGWTLDSAQATALPSVQPISSGETADVEFTPDRPGELTLEFRASNGFLFLSVPIRVK